MFDDNNLKDIAEQTKEGVISKGSKEKIYVT